MKYNIDFSIAGLINYFILIVLNAIQFKKKTKSIKYATGLVVALFFANIFDILSALVISYVDVIPRVVVYSVVLIFCASEVLCAYIFSMYIKCILNEENIGKVTTWLSYCVMGVYGIIILSTPFTNAMFYFDEAGNIYEGWLHFTELIVYFYLIILIVVRFVIKKNNNRLQVASIVAFIGIFIIGKILQVTVLPTVRIAYFMNSVVGFFVFVGFIIPEFVKLEDALSELTESRRLLEIAKKRDEEATSTMHKMTRTASWELVLDKAFNVVGGNWSDEFFWMLGYDRNKLGDQVFTLWNDSLHPDERESIISAFSAGMAGDEAYDVVYRLRNSSGEYRWYRGTGDLKPDTFGEGYIYRGIIQDINEEKIKEDLAKEKLIVISELEKSQSSLREALVKAEAADRAKSNFLAGMSHEIRTPINAVLGMNELIGRESTEANIQEYSAKVADAGQSLLSLINDILDFSKIEAGRFELAPSDYELSGLLREVYNMIYIRCQDRNLDFSINVNPNTPAKLHGDEVRIRQILINFLTNAVKYTDVGFVKLNVDFENSTDNKTTLVMTVSDSGIGIKQEDIDKLFDSFKRVDLEHNRKREGTGLGLNITKSFTELMGGTISVDSVYGEGSSFTVRIPQIVLSDEKIGLFAASSLHKAKKYQASFIAPTADILVVDDVMTNLMVIKGLLKQTKVAITTATSGEDCLEKIKEEKYDIIFLDHMMPGMDGVETLEVMNGEMNHLNKETPVIMLTANAILGVKEEYIGMGFSDYLSKPIRADELENMMIKYLPPEKVVKNK